MIKPPIFSNVGELMYKDKYDNYLYSADWANDASPAELCNVEEVLIVKPSDLHLFIEQKITNGYRAGFEDAIKTMPIEKVADNSFKFKDA